MKKYIEFNTKSEKIFVTLDSINSMVFRHYDTNVNLTINNVIHIDSPTVPKDFTQKLLDEFDGLKYVIEKYVYGDAYHHSKIVVDMTEKTKKNKPDVAIVRIVTESPSTPVKLNNPDIKLNIGNVTNEWDIRVELADGENQVDAERKALDLLKSEIGEDFMVDNCYIYDSEKGETEPSFIRWSFKN